MCVVVVVLERIIVNGIDYYWLDSRSPSVSHLKGLKGTGSTEKLPTGPYLFLIICQIPGGKDSVHFVPDL